MPDIERTDNEKRREPGGRPLTENEWIELINKHDRLSQYAKERKRERRERRREEWTETASEQGLDGN